jgi:putative DNA primase/helicase
VDNNQEIIDVLEEDELVPDASEMVSGSLGRFPDTCTEDGVAQYFVKLHEDDFRVLHDDGGEEKMRLAAWVGTRWSLHDKQYRLLDGSIGRLCRRLHLEMPAPTDLRKKDYRLRFLEWRFQLGVRNLVLALISSAGKSVSCETFDANPLLRGLPRGMVADLAAGTVRAMERADHISRCLKVTPDFQMETPRWSEFLLSIMSGEEDRAYFLERCLGYSMTSIVREHVWFILGSRANSNLRQRGRNGKGSLISVFSSIIGEFAEPLNFDQIMLSKNTNSDLKRTYGQIEGKTFVSVGEASEDEGRQINTSMIKTLTGGDMVSGAVIYKVQKKKKPTWHIWSDMNFTPTLEKTGAMKSRVIFIEFRERYTEENGRVNPILREQLTAESPGILARLIKAAADWYQNGLQVPHSVKAATDRLFQETDYAQRFVNECLIKKEEGFIPDKELGEGLKAFVSQVGEPGASAKTRDLAAVLKAMGSEHIRKGPRQSQVWGWSEIAWGTDKS